MDEKPHVSPGCVDSPQVKRWNTLFETVNVVLASLALAVVAIPLLYLSFFVVATIWVVSKRG